MLFTKHLLWERNKKTRIFESQKEYFLFFYEIQGDSPILNS